jgi:hypothetical protein
LKFRVEGLGLRVWNLEFINMARSLMERCCGGGCQRDLVEGLGSRIFKF